MISFEPHPAQLQALRTTKRFAKGFRPTKLNGDALPRISMSVAYKQIPFRILVAEIGHLCTYLEWNRLVDDLCDRGYLSVVEDWTKCIHAPMEYETDNGSRIFVHDENWCVIDVLRPDVDSPSGAPKTLHYVSRTKGHIECQVIRSAGGDCAESSRAVAEGGVIRGGMGDRDAPDRCYELTRDGYKLLDQHDQSRQRGSAATREEWTPPPGYVGRKTICYDARFTKRGKNPSPTTIDFWVKSAKKHDAEIHIDIDPANHENYYPEDWIMERIATWNPRTPKP